MCQNKEFLSEKSGSFIRNKLNAEINKPKFCQRAHIARFIGMNIASMSENLHFDIVYSKFIILWLHGNYKFLKYLNGPTAQIQ